MGRAEDATLYEAVEDGDVEAARAALDAGADLNMRDLINCTLLHAGVKHALVLELLLQRGADVDAYSDNGTTALHLAAEKGQLESVRVLLQYDANPYCPDIDELTPWNMAKDEATREALRETPARRPETAVPSDVAALLTRLRLFSYGTELCSKFRILSVADMACLNDATLRAELPAMKLAERMRLLTAVVPADALPAATAAFGAAAAVGNANGAGDLPFDLFLSHYQLNGGPQMGMLGLALEGQGKRVWLDRNQVPTEENMKRGVAESAVFLLFLTRGVFSRPYCLTEIREALRLRKPVILLRESDPRPMFVAEGSTIAQQTAASIQEHRAAATAEGLEQLFVDCNVVEYRQVRYEFDAMVVKLCERATATYVTMPPRPPSPLDSATSTEAQGSAAMDEQ